MWGRSSQAPPQSIPPPFTVPPCRRPTLVMVQPPLPMPTFSNPAFVQHSYMLPPIQTPGPIWWDQYPGPSSYQQEYPILSPPDNEMSGYQSPPFRKRKWHTCFQFGLFKLFYQLCALKIFEHQTFSTNYHRWLSKWSSTFLF